MSAVEDKENFSVCHMHKVLSLKTAEVSGNNIARRPNVFSRKSPRTTTLLPPRSAANPCRQSLPAHASATENRYWVISDYRRPHSSELRSGPRW